MASWKTILLAIIGIAIISTIIFYITIKYIVIIKFEWFRGIGYVK